MNPKDIVRAGYDKVSYVYRRDEDSAAVAEYRPWIQDLTILLPANAHVLDLGCGCGFPATKRLAEQFEVVGVDLSPVQIERARLLVPAATFLCEDMTTLNFPSSVFDAVVSFYAVIHIPLEEQPSLFARIFSWLKPGGYFMATVGHAAWTGTESDWLEVEGAEMFWSHTDTATYQQWLQQAGFRILWTRFIPEGVSGHTLVLSQAMDTATG
jgi:cyclopropane fatty-acyl-phospholipid synthase-like methyltransferase